MHRKADTFAPTEEELVMAMAARKIEAELQMQESTGLEKKVDRVQEDVTVLKADVKALQSDVDHLKADTKRVDAKVDAIGSSLTEHRIETEKSLAKVREEIGALRNDVTAAIGALRVEMRDFRSAQAVMLVGVLLAALGAAFTAARYFSA
jgi:phosphoglycerate-specific signal transduction histidine kinase